MTQWRQLSAVYNHKYHNYKTCVATKLIIAQHDNVKCLGDYDVFGVHLTSTSVLRWLAGDSRVHISTCNERDQENRERCGFHKFCIHVSPFLLAEVHRIP